MTLITEIPAKLINLVILGCYGTLISSLPNTLKHIKRIYSDKPFIILHKYKFNDINVDFSSRYKKLTVLYNVLLLDVYRHYRYYF